MGYFSNGTDGDLYQSRFCDHCVHNNEEFGCPCWEAHQMWNYEECNKPDSILHKMIPRTDMGNGVCMFFQKVR